MEATSKQEEDVVLGKIPVFFSKSLTDHLFVFEYPREEDAFADVFTEQTVVKARIKPKQQKVELHMEFCKNSNNFNPGQAKKWCIKSKSAQASESSGSVVETQILCSAFCPIEQQFQLAVAAMHQLEDGRFEFHLHQTDTVIDLRESYKYMNGDKKVEQEKKQVEGKPPVTKPITVRFARQDPKRLAEMQAKSPTVQKRIRDAEPWCNVDFYPTETRESQLELMKMVEEQAMSNANAVLTDKAEAFLPKVFLREMNQKALALEAKEKFKPTSEIIKMSFTEQVTERIKQAHLISFAAIKTYLDPRKSNAEIIGCLQRVATPVRGNWVLNSDFIFPKDFISNFGATKEQLCRGRDKILFMFTQNAMVKLNDIMQATYLPPEDIKGILLRIADKMKTSTESGWTFKLPEDMDFIQKHPEEVDRLFKKFELKVINMERRAEEERASGEMRSSTSPAKKAKVVPRVRKNSSKSRQDSHSSDH